MPLIMNRTHDILNAIDQLTHSTTAANPHNISADITELHQAVADELAAAEHLPDFSGVHLSLSQYLEAVKMVVADTFDHEVWIQAEIRAVNSKGGHYYFELAEKDDKGNIIASTRATLWRYRASAVVGKFTKTTGNTLGAGLAILLKGSASFHPQYGFSINISDIDPTYTLGALAQAYHAMLKRLHDEGLTLLNKSLPTPFDIRHVIVIAPENAAGLGDFRAEADRLAQAEACRFYYHHATFQGNHAPTEIRTAVSHAIHEFYHAHAHHADLLVIIRGGGAVGDLAYLNDYELCALVAESPMPVWVGVGHERDKILLDEVAHTRFDTPSKVIHAIETHLVNMVNLAKTAMHTITQSSLTNLNSAKEKTTLAMTNLHHRSTQNLRLASKDSLFLLSHLKHHTKHHTHTHKQHIQTLLTRQQNSAHQHLHHAHQISRQALQQHNTLLPRLHALREDTRHLQSLILLQHPSRTLAKGYALIRQDNALVGSKHALNTGEIAIEFFDGTTTAVVK